MTDACTAARQAGGFIGSMTGYIDCQSQTLGLGAWQAFAAPGSTLTIVLTAFLTIFIALIGYNLLLGSSLTVRGTTVAFVKIGAVFALATSWPAYRTVVYNLVTDGPSQLIAEIGPRAGVIGSDGTLVQRLDLTDQALVQLAILGPGQARPSDYRDVQPPPFIGFDSFALGGSRILFLLSAIAGLGVVRLIAGLLLGLGPFFMAFLMFEGTRSLFEGWVRVLSGAALSTIAVSIVLGFELGLTDPWLSNVLARRMAGEPLPTVPTELFVITCLFAIAVIASIYASMRVAGAFRLPGMLREQFAQIREDRTARTSQVSRLSGEQGRRNEAERTRAAAIASAFTTVNRRERDDSATSTGTSSAQERVPDVRSASTENGRQSIPLGKSFARRPGSRVSALAARRDA